MSAQENQAVWLTSAKGYPFVVKESQYPEIDTDQILVETRAVAANPIDYKQQAFEMIPMTYPNILGFDLAGEVIEIGSNVKSFKKGDRILSQPLAAVTGKTAEAGFQKYVACSSVTSAVIPPSMSFEQAVVLLACFSTAAMALFSGKHLGLDLPKLEPTAKNKTLFVWGGSSASGSNAIQLGKAAGYEIVVTASAKNHSYCKSLGANHVFDYNKDNVVDNIVTELAGKDVIGGFDTISEDTLKTTIDILDKVGAKRVASTHPFTEHLSTSKVQVTGVMAAAFFMEPESQPIWSDFLPRALKSGSFLAKPGPVVVGKGLESVQAAVDTFKGPVSAQKIVVTL